VKDANIVFQKLPSDLPGLARSFAAHCKTGVLAVHSVEAQLLQFHSLIRKDVVFRYDDGQEGTYAALPKKNASTLPVLCLPSDDSIMAAAVRCDVASRLWACKRVCIMYVSSQKPSWMQVSVANCVLSVFFVLHNMHWATHSTSGTSGIVPFVTQSACSTAPVATWQRS
jgi:hypothetical protein